MTSYTHNLVTKSTLNENTSKGKLKNYSDREDHVIKSSHADAIKELKDNIQTFETEKNVFNLFT